MHGQMTLARLIWDSIARGSQFVIATHSPFLTAFPNASIHLFTTNGIERVEFDDIPLIDLWKRFFADPIGYYDRLLGED